jgi:ABC-2 type transport system ATP-binding protein
MEVPCSSRLVAPSLRVHSGAPLADAESRALSANAIGYRYDSTPTLSDVSLGVSRGSITGLVGRNGAGKSTLIKVLCGLLVPEHGSVDVLGQPRPVNPGDMMRDTGWLLSEPALFQYLTASETLTFLAKTYGLDDRTAAKRMSDLLQFFELDEHHERLADELSTGTAKRLALACAMIHAPRLLVLDEPFESLDPLMVRRLRQALVAYAKRGGSVLLSSHLLEVVQDICDHVYILEQGRVVFDGPGVQFRAASEVIGSGNGGGGALEAMYASLVEERGVAELDWL